MPTQIQTRNYHFPDADLSQRADALKNTIIRDLADFASRNISTGSLEDYQLLIDDFNNSSTDVELAGQVQDATLRKDNLVLEVQKAIRPIRNMADIAYNGKGKYATFGFDDLSRQSDNELIRMGRRVVRVGTRLLPELQSQGLTEDIITNLSNLVSNLDETIDEQQTAIENRDLETQDRIIKGNILWAEMLRLASIGKSLYEDTNEAKFNDYVMAEGGGSAAPPTPPVV
jgi:hypothetical protein